MYEERITNCAERIAEALALRKAKAIDICKLTGIPKSSMSLYLSGAYEPKQDRIHTIAKALNVSEARLMGYDVPMERPAPSETTHTDEEVELVTLFRKLSDDKRKFVIDMIKLTLGM